MTKKTSQKNARYQLLRRGLIAVAAISVSILLGVLLLNGKNIAVLNPQGIIADQQKALIIFTVLLALIIIVPVFVMLFVFAWRYRESNKKATYTPNADQNKWLEGLWWGIPVVIILALSVITWITTHELDPYRPLASEKRPVKIQVVSLQWKWLFMYPDQGVASINEVRFPEDTPIEFSITADSPMSGFWIPNLGTQTYAMNGMTSKLSLQAHNPGEYRGTNTNISGEGYAKMDFKAISLSQNDFEAWVSNLAKMDSHLTWSEYEKLAQPSKELPATYYMLHEPDIYDRIMVKYMGHGSTETKRDLTHHEGH